MKKTMSLLASVMLVGVGLEVEAIVGELHICKGAANADANFTFTIEAGQVWISGTGAGQQPTPAPSPFVLNPADGASGVDCETFDVPTSQPDVRNIVVFSETGVPEEDPPWSLADVTCTNGTPGGGDALYTSTDNWLQIELTEGESGGPDVTCTFTSARAGSLTIVKDAEPNGPTAFSYTGSFGSFQLSDNGGGWHLHNQTTFDLLDGSYTVIESELAGWSLANISCTNHGLPMESGFTVNGGQLEVDVGAVDEVRCIFTNGLNPLIFKDGFEALPPVCEPAEVEACYEGPPETLNVGLCTWGTRVCAPDGSWGACNDWVGPVTEVCGDGQDNDCDGAADVGCTGDDCDPLNSASTCLGGLGCYIDSCSRNICTAACGNAGRGQAGSTCLINSDCGSGLQCWDNVCLWSCDPDNPSACSRGSSCDLTGVTVDGQKIGACSLVF